MDTNVKKQKNGQPKVKVNPRRKTVKGVFNSMLTFYVEQMKRENFYVDDYFDGTYRFIVDTLTKEIEQDFSKATEYAKILEVADRFYKKVLDSKIRERVIDEDMKPEDFMICYGDEILGEYRRSFDRSHNYIKGLIKLGEETVITTVGSDEVFRSTKSFDMDAKIPYTDIGSIFDKGRRDMEKVKTDEERSKPKQILEVKKALDLKQKAGEVFPFDYQEGKVILQEVGELEYSVEHEGKHRISRYKVSKEIEGKEPSEEYVFSHIDLYEMRENIQYREAVLGELLSDNNISKSNASGYIGELSDSIGELERMKIGDEIDDGDYIYKTPHKSKNGQYYGLVYDAQDLSAVVELEKQQKREKDQAEQQPKDKPKKEEKPEEELEL